MDEFGPILPRDKGKDSPFAPAKGVTGGSDMDERDDQGFDLFRQAKQIRDEATKAVSSALDMATTTVTDATQGAQTAVSGAVDSYKEALDDVVAQLPTFGEVVGQASRLPGVAVKREWYFAEVFGRKYADKVAIAIATTPCQAGLTGKQIEKFAKSSIGKESRRTTLISMATGIPGGAAVAATIPADLVQLYGHLMRAIQKLSYLYGWRDFVRLDGREPDAATRAALILFLGSMSKVEQANEALGQVARLRMGSFADQALRDAMLTAEIQTVVEETSVVLGDRLTRRLTGQVVDKAIPVAGGIISGIVTRGDFGSMCDALHRQLKVWGA